MNTLFNVLADAGLFILIVNGFARIIGIPTNVGLWQLASPYVSRLLGPRYSTLEVGYVGNQKIAAIKEIRNVTGLGLKEAKDAAEGKPLTITRSEAKSLASRIRSHGIDVDARKARRSK